MSMILISKQRRPPNLLTFHEKLGRPSFDPISDDSDMRVLIVMDSVVTENPIRDHDHDPHHCHYY